MREHKTVGHPQHRNYNNTNAQACQWVNDRKKMLLSRSSLAREDTPKIVYAMLSGKSESHAHTLIPIITSFKRCFCF